MKEILHQLKKMRHLLPLIAGLLMLSMAVNGQTVIQTDKSDYQPGDTVIISGSGWLPGELVEMRIREIPTHNPDILIQATADTEGNITTKDL